MTDPVTELRKILTRRWLTARQIAEHFECGKLTAYRRVRALREQGYRVFERPTREGKTGPLSKAFHVP